MVANTPEARMALVASGKFAGMEQRAVSKLCRCVPRYRNDPEEAASVVRTITVEAAHAYEEGRDTQFSSYVHSALFWHVQHHLDRLFARQREGSERWLSGWAGNPDMVNHVAAAWDRSEQVRELLSKLSQASRTVWLSLLENGGWTKSQLTAVRVARCAGCTIAAAREFLSEVRELIPRCLEGIDGSSESSRSAAGTVA